MLRPHQIRSFILASPSSSIRHNARTFAISIHPPRVWTGKDDQRVFSERKTYLYHQFTNMLKDAPNQPMIFLQHKNFRANAMAKLRKDIAAATLPKGTSVAKMDAPPALESLPRFNIIRTSIFGVALRSFAPLDTETTQRIATLAGGSGLAVLSLPSLDPPQLNAILKALARAVPKRRKNDESGKSNKNSDDGFIPGRRQKRLRPILTPELSLLGAFIEGRVFAAEGVKDIAALPNLDTLRAQIVGLLQSPAVQLVLVLQEASGGRLARTLEGLQKGLEEGENEAEV